MCVEKETLTIVKITIRVINMKYTTTEKEGIVTYKCIPDGYNGMYFFCPYCERFHSHGTTEDFKSVLKADHRLEHCYDKRIPGSGFTKTERKKNHTKGGYYIKRFTDKELKMIRDDINNYLDSLPNSNNRYNI